MMNASELNGNRVLAFEVAKGSLVVHELPLDQQRTILSRGADIRRLLRKALRDSPSTLLVVCEASGGYDKHELQATCDLSIACHRAQGLAGHGPKLFAGQSTWR
jgi:transposase